MEKVEEYRWRLQHLIYRKLYQIESYLHDRYYPFILEEIPDLYDKMQSICVSIGSIFES